MAEAAVAAGRWSVPGLEVEADARTHIAALRYFEPAGAFAAAVSAALTGALPAPLTAACVTLTGAADGVGIVLAWVRPTETLALSESSAALTELTARLAGAADGHVVDLSGGLRVLRLSGARVADFMARLGGSAGAPRLEEARRGRLADVPVLALGVPTGEVLLVVDRAYAEHLAGWIRATLADWTDAGSQSGDS